MGKTVNPSPFGTTHPGVEEGSIIKEKWQPLDIKERRKPLPKPSKGEDDVETPPINNTKAKGGGKVVTGTSSKTAPAKMYPAKEGEPKQLDTVKKMLYEEKGGGETVAKTTGGSKAIAESKGPSKRENHTNPPLGRGKDINKPAWMREEGTHITAEELAKALQFLPIQDLLPALWDETVDVAELLAPNEGKPDRELDEDTLTPITVHKLTRLNIEEEVEKGKKSRLIRILWSYLERFYDQYLRVIKSHIKGEDENSLIELISEEVQSRSKSCSASSTVIQNIQEHRFDVKRWYHSNYFIRQSDFTVWV